MSVQANLEKDEFQEKEKRIDLLLASGRKLLDNNENSLAINVYGAVLKLDPHNPEALFGLGSALEKRGRFENAITCFSRWSRLVQTVPPLIRLASLYLKLNNDPKVIECLEKALNLNPKNENDRYEVFNHLGNAYLRQGQLEKSDRLYNQALQIKPHSDRTHVNLGTLRFQQGNIEKAQFHYGEGYRLNPTNTKAICGLGLVAQEKKDWEDALRYFVSALEVDSTELVAIHGMIRVGQQLKKYEVIDVYLKKFLRVNPSNIAIIYCLAGNYFHQKKWRECREEIDKIELLDAYHEPTQELKRLVLEVNP